MVSELLRFFIWSWTVLPGDTPITEGVGSQHTSLECKSGAPLNVFTKVAAAPVIASGAFASPSQSDG